jgi:phage terminase large subunit
VYEEFDPEVHVHKRIQVPPISWTRYITVDFGYTNPMVVQFWAKDEDDRLYLYKELYQTKTLVEDMAPLIKAGMNLKKEPRPQMIICDHDAEGRATLEKHLGMSTKAAKKTVEDGIQSVKSRMIRSEVDGRPKIYLCEDAVQNVDKDLRERKKPTSTLEEVVGYVWDRGTAIAQANGKPPKEEPLKVDDHGMDAMRYMVAQLDLRNRPRIRTITY